MRAQRGNALFLILIAVALFAALSYAVTQTGRGGGSIERETRLIETAQMLQAHAAVKTAVDRMVIVTTAPDALELNNGADPEVPCTSGSDCVFALDGGGAEPLKASNWDNILSDPEIYYYQIDDGYSIAGLGSAAADAFIMTVGISETVCTEINTRLGVAVPIEQEDTDNTVLGDGTAYAGEWSFCMQRASAGTPYAYIQALAAE